MKLYAITQNLNKDGLAIKSEGLGGSERLFITLNRQSKSVYYIVFTEKEFLVRDKDSVVVFHDKAKRQKGEILPRSRQLKGWPKGI